MYSTSQSSPSRRLFKVLVTAAALPLIALAPALLVSLVLTQGAVDHFEPIGHATTIDVTDIDENGTVMYTVSPPEGFRNEPDIDFTVPADVLKDSDLIRITVSDDDNSLSFFESENQEDCSFTLHLSDDDRYDAKTGTYTGYLRVTDEETARFAGSDIERLETCGLYVIYTD